MRRAFAVFLLACTVDAVGAMNPIVPLDLVKGGMLVLDARERWRSRGLVTLPSSRHLSERVRSYLSRQASSSCEREGER